MSAVTGVGWLAAAAAMVAGFGSVAAWQRVPERAPSAEPVAAVQLDGAALFQSKGCAGCHTGPDSRAMIGDTFPSLEQASGWAGRRRPGLTAAGYLAESMREPAAFISPAFDAGAGGPFVSMPDLGLTDDEVQALVEYLLAG